MTYSYHKDGTAPPDDHIFVFGSNLSGRHGAGAALYAHQKCGAKMHEPFGVLGTSFAIPTKDRQIQTMSLDDIKRYVERFIAYAIKHPEKKFWVTRIGCGLAGYKDSDIAPMFKYSPLNCDFAIEWRTFLDAK